MIWQIWLSWPPPGCTCLCFEECQTTIAVLLHICRKTNSTMDTVSFKSAPSFCPDCGSILPILDEKMFVICYSCKRKWDWEVFGDMSIAYTIHFNNEDAYVSSTMKTDDDEEEAEGPIVERRCPQCQNEKMSYATLQLRSADEGQTVFYTCTKCKFKETENS